MSENTNVPAPKTTKAPKAAKKVEKAAAKSRDRGMADVPAATRRVEFIKALRKMGATSATSAKPVSAIAAKLGYGNYDVYCLGYHKYPLAVEGYVKQCKLEDSRELHFYLTAKGQKNLPE